MHEPNSGPNVHGASDDHSRPDDGRAALSRCVHMMSVRRFVRYPKRDVNFCSKLFLFKEPTNFRSCCPYGLRVIRSATTARNLTTPPKGKQHWQKLRTLFSLGVRATNWVVIRSLLYPSPSEDPREAVIAPVVPLPVGPAPASPD